jgi:hypothetical protein
MKRREFITLLGGAAVWPLVARAQPSERVRRIGALIGAPESDPESQARVAAFREGLEQRGWSASSVGGTVRPRRGSQSSRRLSLGRHRSRPYPRLRR